MEGGKANDDLCPGENVRPRSDADVIVTFRAHGRDRPPSPRASVFVNVGRGPPVGWGGDERKRCAAGGGGATAVTTVRGARLG